MKITVLYNRVESLSFGKPEDILADQDTVTTAQDVAQGLSSLGHRVDLFAVAPESIARLKSHNTEFFFNNAFGIGDLPKTEG